MRVLEQFASSELAGKGSDGEHENLDAGYTQRYKCYERHLRHGRHCKIG